MASQAHGNFSGKRLVIAGCGYVGAAVAEHALAAGATVTAITRNATTAAALRAGGIEAVLADLAGEAWHAAIAHAPDFLLNCVSSGGGGVEAYRHSYLEGMESVLRWSRRVGGVGTIVYTSSTSVYPQGGGVVVDEQAQTVGGTAGGAKGESGNVRGEAGTGALLGSPEVIPGGDRPEEPMSRAAILCETERRLTEGSGACDRWFVLRLAGIYGPGRHYLLDQIRGGLVAGHGQHHLNLAHRDDVAAAILACFGAPPGVRSQIFNVADDAAATKADVVGWLASRLDVPRPAFSGTPAGTRRPVTPDRIIANAKLKSVLGWTPRFPSFREGYEAILAPPT